MQSQFVYDAKNPEYFSVHETDKMDSGLWREKNLLWVIKEPWTS